MNIRLLVLDVDGVLTDGTFLLHGAEGEWKAFHASDGLGIRHLIDAGVQVAFLTGRDSPVVSRRGSELGVREVVQGRKDKGLALRELSDRAGVALHEIAFMGDDLVDVPAMRAAGFSAAPADARPEAREAADWVAPSAGGHGAVRDLSDHLLREMGLWDEVLARYRG